MYHKKKKNLNLLTGYPGVIQWDLVLSLVGNKLWVEQ